MAKKTEAGEFVSPANLWGKPMPNLTGKPVSASAATEEKAKRMLAEDEDGSDSDVDAELEETTEPDSDVVSEDDNEQAYVHAAAEEDSTDDDDDDADDDDDDGDDAEEEEEDDEDVADTAVDVDEEDPAPVPVTAGASKKKVTNMSEKKSGADYIRDEIAKRQEAGDSLRGVDIVSALAKRRITVSPAQVSQLLKKAGLGGAPRGKRAAVAAGEGGKTRAAGKAKKPHAAAEPTRAAPKAAKPGNITGLPMDQLKAATAFLAACNDCYETAGEILSAHKQLGSMLSR